MNHPVPDSIDDLMKDARFEWVQDFDSGDFKCKVRIRVIAIPEKDPSQLIGMSYGHGIRHAKAMLHMLNMSKVESDLMDTMRKKLSERPMIQSKWVPEKYLSEEVCRLQNELYEKLSMGTTENGDYRIPILGYIRRPKSPDADDVLGALP